MLLSVFVLTCTNSRNVHEKKESLWDLLHFFMRIKNNQVNTGLLLLENLTRLEYIFRSAVFLQKFLIVSVYVKQTLDRERAALVAKIIVYCRACLYLWGGRKKRLQSTEDATLSALVSVWKYLRCSVSAELSTETPLYCLSEMVSASCHRPRGRRQVAESRKQEVTQC